MKKLFTAIRKDDFETVKALLEKDKSLVSCVAKQPPKSDDGQSPLQVALKTGKLEIANYLIDLGADVNFIESENCLNIWRAPVIHDAINAAIMLTRWNTNIGEFREYNSEKEANKAFEILKKMIKLGANVNSIDSLGNNCIKRACLQARQILPRYDYSLNKICDDRILTKELQNDLQRIFKLLIDNGANLSFVNTTNNQTIFEEFKNEPVLDFLK